MMGFYFTGDWDKLVRRLDPAARARIERASDKSTKQAALMTVAEIRKGIQRGGFFQNAPFTIALKGSSKPLVDKGRLFQSITQKRVRRAHYFIGVLKSSSKYNIAVTLHEGASIPVTPRMRGLFKLLHRVTLRAYKARSASKPKGVGPKAVEQSTKPWIDVTDWFPPKEQGGTRAGTKKGGTKRADPLAGVRSARARELALIAIRKRVVIPELGSSASFIRIPSRPFIGRVFYNMAFRNKIKTLWMNMVVRALKGQPV